MNIMDNDEKEALSSICSGIEMMWSHTVDYTERWVRGTMPDKEFVIKLNNELDYLLDLHRRLHGLIR